MGGTYGEGIRKEMEVWGKLVGSVVKKSFERKRLKSKIFCAIVLLHTINSFIRSFVRLFSRMPFIFQRE